MLISPELERGILALVEQIEVKLVADVIKFLRIPH
jgi:hypothetical protein